MEISHTQIFARIIGKSSFQCKPDTANVYCVRAFQPSIQWVNSIYFVYVREMRRAHALLIKWNNKKPGHYHNLIFCDALCYVCIYIYTQQQQQQQKRTWDVGILDEDVREERARKSTGLCSYALCCGKKFKIIFFLCRRLESIYVDVYRERENLWAWGWRVALFFAQKLVRIPLHNNTSLVCAAPYLRNNKIIHWMSRRNVPQALVQYNFHCIVHWNFSISSPYFPLLHPYSTIFCVLFASHSCIALEMFSSPYFECCYCIFNTFMQNKRAFFSRWRSGFIVKLSKFCVIFFFLFERYFHPYDEMKWEKFWCRLFLTEIFDDLIWYVYIFFGW